MDALLRYGRGYEEVEGGQIPDRRGFASTACPRAGRPTPEPNENVVFISHFLLGLGLTLDPFVRGLMFYYGLDFHDLAPDSFLHISAFYCRM